MSFCVRTKRFSNERRPRAPADAHDAVEAEEPADTQSYPKAHEFTAGAREGDHQQCIEHWKHSFGEELQKSPTHHEAREHRGSTLSGDPGHMTAKEQRAGMNQNA